MDARGAVEAALFSAAENLKLSQIAEKTGLPESEVRTALMDLRKEYDQREGAIIIAKIGSEYRMMLRPEYSECATGFAKAEMPPGVMRTLSTIAYNQPVLQSELFKTRGPRTYDDVHRLVEMGFVAAKRSGQTMELTTTKKFSDYFGIGSTRKADIRAWIESQMSAGGEGQQERVPRATYNRLQALAVAMKCDFSMAAVCMDAEGAVASGSLIGRSRACPQRSETDGSGAASAPRSPWRWASSSESWRDPATRAPWPSHPIPGRPARPS